MADKNSNDNDLGYESDMDDARESTTSVFECDLLASDDSSDENEDISVSIKGRNGRRTNSANSNTNNNSNSNDNSDGEPDVKRRKLNAGGKKPPKKLLISQKYH